MKHLEEAARRTPEAIALELFEERYSYAQLWTQVSARARQLKGKRSVAVVGGLSLEAIVDLWAALTAVPLVCLIHAKLQPAERAKALALVCPELVLEEGRIDLLESAASGDSLREGRLSGVVFFTSGSTGGPKAVLLQRAAIEASARASQARLGTARDDAWLLALPTAHVGGFSILVRMAMVSGRAVIRAPGRFEPVALLDQIERSAITLCSLVPTMLSDLVATGRSPGSSLKAVLIGGAPAGATLLTRAWELGWPAITTYGLTETASQVSLQSPEEARAAFEGTGAALGGAGRPLDGVQVWAVEGRIWVRGPNLLLGYLEPARIRDPRESVELSDGWFNTQDLGEVDEAGHLHIRGRAGTMLITGGENVHPEEVEAVLTEHPAVQEACVVGLPDARWGAVLAAAVVLSQDASTDVILAFVEARLASFKRPRELWSLPELPRGKSGKIDRAAVLRWALKNRAQDSLRRPS